MSTERDLERLALAGELAYAQSIASGATGRLLFEDALAEVEQRAASLSALGESVARARARGYVWGADLETTLAQATSGAAQHVAAARTEARSAGAALRRQAEELDRSVRRAGSGDLLRQAGEVNRTAAAARGLDEAINAARARVLAAAGPLNAAVESLGARLQRAHWTLDCFESASFRMQPEENPLFAAKATWDDHPGGAVPGLLLCTGHHVRFEVVEEVVLERSFVFFASRTEQRRKLAFDAAVGHLRATEPGERGLLMKDQLVTLRFASQPGLPSTVTLVLPDDRGQDVHGVLSQIRAGDFERGRFQGAMPAGSNVGRPVRWPEECSTCGARLQPPVRGQTYVTCEYCNARFDVVLGEG